MPSRTAAGSASGTTWLAPTMPALPAEHPHASSAPRSRSTTDAPSRASSRAVHTPTAPPPITATSAVLFRLIRTMVATVARGTHGYRTASRPGSDRTPAALTTSRPRPTSVSRLDETSPWRHLIRRWMHRGHRGAPLGPGVARFAQLMREHPSASCHARTTDGSETSQAEVSVGGEEPRDAHVPGRRDDDHVSRLAEREEDRQRTRGVLGGVASGLLEQRRCLTCSSQAVFICSASDSPPVDV